MARWLGIVGIGEGGLDDLAPRARALVDEAEILVGGARHLAMLPADHRPRITWRSPLAEVIEEIAGRKPRRVAVLASGDPMCFGVGVTLARRVPMTEMEIHPAPSAFSLACARLGWPVAEVETLTLHGRPLELLNAYPQPGARLLILSEDGTTPAQVAARLVALGYGRSRLWVFEHMDGAAERLIEGTAAGWDAPRAADLNTIAVDCVADADAPLRPRGPGLPDDAFAHDGQLTKREMRGITLARLGPVSGQLLWDVGAGAGSIAIEWMRAAPGARAVAIEHRPDRVALIERNAAALGVPKLDIIAGEAPAALAGLAPPEAVFIGGGAGTPELFETCWEALASGGRLVANVVTLEGEAAVLGWRARIGGELTRIAVSRAAPAGRFTGWKPLMPVTQFAAVKP